MTVLSGLLSMGIFFFFLPWQMLRSEISSSLDASLGGWLSDKRTGRRGSGRIGQQSYMWKCDRISSACYGGIPVGWRRTEAHNPRRGSSHFLLEVPLAVWNTTNKLKLANALGKPSFWWPNSETWVGKWTAATNNSNSEETSWDQYKVQDCKLSLMLLQRKIVLKLIVQFHIKTRSRPHFCPDLHEDHTLNLQFYNTTSIFSQRSPNTLPSSY